MVTDTKTQNVELVLYFTTYVLCIAINTTLIYTAALIAAIVFFKIDIFNLKYVTKRD